MARRPRKPKSQTMDEASDEYPVDLFTGKMKELELTTERFGQTLSKVFAQGIARGRSFDDILRSIGQKFVEMSLRMAFKPIEGLFGGFFNGLLKSFTGSLTGGGGLSNLFSGLFGGGSGAAAAGAGGIAGAGGAAMAKPAGANIIMNISTPDADSFRRSEAQVSAALARAVARGERSL